MYPSACYCLEGNVTDVDGYYENGEMHDDESVVDTEKPSYWNVFKNGELVAQYDGDWLPHYNGADKDEYDKKHLVYDIEDSSTEPQGSFAIYYPKTQALIVVMPLLINLIIDKDV